MFEAWIKLKKKSMTILIFCFLKFLKTKISLNKQTSNFIKFVNVFIVLKNFFITFATENNNLNIRNLTFIYLCRNLETTMSTILQSILKKEEI
jgi:hypothetical protein